MDEDGLMNRLGIAFQQAVCPMTISSAFPGRQKGSKSTNRANANFGWPVHRAWSELEELRDHSAGASMDHAEGRVAEELSKFLDPAHVAFIPLMQQLLAAEDCLQQRTQR
jgi:hypothetical protein